MNTEKIKQKFDLVANEYDLERKKFIPCYDDYYKTSINFLAQAIPMPSTILDLGAGTGLLSQCLDEYFPKAKFTLVDISDQMLAVAKKRFQGLSNFSYTVSDYAKEFTNGSFDLIASALSIHHLENHDKLALYRNIFTALPQDGCFINLDQFDADSAFVNNLYQTWWYDYIAKSGLPKGRYDQWLQRRTLDKENTVDETKKMLISAGFTTVECIYSFMKFGVVIAFKGK